MRTARSICLTLLIATACFAAAFACANTGKRIAARIAMIAITTSSSMRVKPFLSMQYPSGSIGRAGDKRRAAAPEVPERPPLTETLFACRARGPALKRAPASRRRHPHDADRLDHAGVFRVLRGLLGAVTRHRAAAHDCQGGE